MPAFGLTHTEEQLWGIVAFVEEVPRVTPEEYQKLVVKSSGSGLEHGHGEMKGEEQQGQGNGEPSAHEEGIEAHD